MPASVHILKYLNILWFLETKLAHAVNDFDESKWRVLKKTMIIIVIYTRGQAARGKEWEGRGKEWGGEGR